MGLMGLIGLMGRMVWDYLRFRLSMNMAAMAMRIADECECGHGGLSRLNARRDGEHGVGGGIIGAGRMKNRFGCGILNGVDIHRVTSSAGFSLTGDDNFGSVGRNGKSHGV